jgi:outer membrane protein OmpA-like peptidoglycan-associated protein
MKHVLVLCLLLTASSLFALDSVFLGIGAEANAYTREGAAFGGGLSFGLDLNQHISLGIKGAYSNNFDTVSAVDPALFFRWYPPLPKKGLFAQAELGGIFFFEDGKSYPALLGAASLGWRFTLPKNLYIEPYIKSGYPVKWGAGFNFGITIPIEPKEKTPSAEVMASREALAAEITAMLEQQNIADTTAKATNEGVVITLSNIQFEAESAVLPQSERRKLQEIANILKAVPERNILIAGHAASTGDASGELKISRERAFSVADYLVSLGARTHNEIVVSGHGSSRPVADNATAEGRAANRRVEITILGN